MRNGSERLDLSSTTCRFSMGLRCARSETSDENSVCIPSTWMRSNVCTSELHPMGSKCKTVDTSSTKNETVRRRADIAVPDNAMLFTSTDGQVIHD